MCVYNRFMRHISRSWFLAVLACACAFAVIIQIPQFLHLRDPRSQGIAVALNSDEEVYLARVEEALSGRPEQSSEAFIGDPALRGSQPAILERLMGTVFAPTGWRAATVLQIVDSVTVFFLFLSILWFLRQSGFSRASSLSATLLFCVIELYNLNRPVHQALSLLLLLTALNLVIAGRERSVRWVIPGAVFLGLLFGDYFWTWSFGWLWVGLLILWECIEWMRTRRQSAQAVRLILCAAFGAIAAVPFLLQLLGIMRDPLSQEAVFRSGMHPSHLPESWPYSILFAVMALGTGITVWKHPEKMRQYRYAVVTVFAAFIVIHQHLLHGLVFNFVSHYLLTLVLSAIIAVLLWHSIRSRVLLLSALAACVYLAAVAYDGRHVLRQFTVRDRFQEQHFSTLLPVLDALPRATILSDPETSSFIAGSTKHDIVYSLYLKNVLMQSEEIARRYCATLLPLAAGDRHLHEGSPVYPDAVSAFKDDPSVRDREIAMVDAACAAADGDPGDVLRTFHVQYVLWNEKYQLRWDLKRLNIPLTKAASGSGWSLWEVTGASPR